MRLGLSYRTSEDLVSARARVSEPRPSLDQPKGPGSGKAGGGSSITSVGFRRDLRMAGMATGKVMQVRD